MRPVLNWIDKISEDDDSESGCCVYDLAFKPDGSELLVAADTKVLIYDGSDGTLLQSLKGHKDLVYAVAFSYNGERFASGSADRSVIIWTEQHEGTLKYTHNEAIQCLSFSPVACLLLSCAVNDFGMWTHSEKSVSKQRTTSRCVSCAWSCSGQFYAIGMFDGTISIRSSSSGEEAKRIERPSGEPVWAIAFGAARASVDSRRRANVHSEGGYFGEVLAVADWGQTAAFYDLEGNQITREEKKLGYDPTGIDYFNYGQFLVMCGSNRQVILYSREGTTLGTIAQMDTWVWTAKARPGTNAVVVGCVDGTLACYQLMFSTVHGLHKERYAYRENMTDVVVQHLGKQTSVRLLCNDLVRKVAIYHNRLAIQLTDRVHIYRQTSEREDGQLEYRLVDRINRAFECSLLVVCAQHLILCQEKRLQCYDHKGLKQREWVLESLIRYIKVIGGPPGREAILIGLKNGAVCKIFVDNPFAIQMLHLKSAVRCLDISHLRKKLAVVDETGVCMIFDAATKQLLFQEPSSNSVAWNADQENLLCFSGNGALSIKAHNFAPHQQRMQGFVVGFSGKRVFCLHMFAMTAMEVPLSKQLYQYLEQGMHEEAYELASLGVTERDWTILAHDALQKLKLEISKKAFHKVKDAKYLQLISEIEEMRANNENNDLIMAYMKAYEGRFRDAALLFQSSGFEEKSLEMFTDLRMFDQAQELLTTASGETQKALMRRRADWARDSNEPRFAAEMFVASGDYDKAIKLMVENGWTDMLVNLMHRIDPKEVESLRTIGTFLASKKEFALATQIFLSINDMKSLIKMYVSSQQWNDAFAIALKNPKYKEDVYLPYARWLAENDRFEEAQKAYHMAGFDVEALRVLERLTDNAVKENRFLDAGYYHWMLSMQYLERSSSNPQLLSKFHESSLKADCYYAYDAIHKYLAEPFTSRPADALVNIARFLAFQPEIHKISRVAVMYALAKQSRALGAYKLARYALEQLSYLKVPGKFEKLIAIATVLIRAKPFTDADELLPMCYRCGVTNPLTGGNACVHCKSPFIYSFVSFEVLPLVEFEVVDGISTEEARQLIEAEPPLSQNSNPLQKQMQKKAGAITADREMLVSLEKSQVVIVDWPSPLKARFYFNVIPEISISKCNSCQHIFHMDDFEMAYLKYGTCPFCRSIPQRQLNLHLVDQEELEEL